MSSEHAHACGDPKCAMEQREVTIFDAAKTGSVDGIQYFVSQNGVEVLKQRDDKGHTIAHWAALGGHTAALRYLIQQKAPFDEPSNNELKQHPIHWACVNGHIAAVDILVQAGVSMDAMDSKGCTPLIVAAQYGKTMMAGYLMGKGANKLAADRDGDTALHWAAFKGHPELIRLLVYSGLNPHQSDNYGQQPIHLACINGNLNSVKDLVEKDQVEITLKDKNGKSPLMLAQGRRHEEVIKYLGGQVSLKTKIIAKFDFWAILFGSPGRGRFPMLVYLFVTLILGYPMYVYKAVPMTWDLMPEIHYAFLLLNLIMWISFYYANKIEPGFLPTNIPDYDQAIKQVAYFDEWKQGRNPLSRLCHTCRTVKTIRSKHCKICNRCVKQMDHHCPYINNCVGLNNRLPFAIFVLDVAVTGYLALKIGLTVWRLEQWIFSILYVFLFLLTILFEFMALIVSGFTIMNIFDNLTTNERANWKRYTYLKNENGKYKNIFNRGWRSNCLEFFKFKRSLTEEELEFMNVRVI